MEPNLAIYKQIIETVSRVRSGDPQGMEDLYKLLGRGVRFLLLRQVGPDQVEDRLHDVFMIVAEAIKEDKLREPERLMGFVRTVVQRQVAGHIGHAVQDRARRCEMTVELADRKTNPEATLIQQQKLEWMTATLREMSQRDREILTRFYLDEQTPEQICSEMGLTETQFRLLKSRAKVRFGSQGQKKMEGRALRIRARVMAAFS